MVNINGMANDDLVSRNQYAEFAIHNFLGSVLLVFATNGHAHSMRFSGQIQLSVDSTAVLAFWLDSVVKGVEMVHDQVISVSRDLPVAIVRIKTLVHCVP